MDKTIDGTTGRLIDGKISNELRSNYVFFSTYFKKIMCWGPKLRKLDNLLMLS